MCIYGMPIECTAFRFVAGAKNHFLGYPAPLIADCEILIPWESVLYLRPVCRANSPHKCWWRVWPKDFTVKMKIVRVSGFTGTSLASESQPRRGWDMFFRT